MIRAGARWCDQIEVRPQQCHLPQEIRHLRGLDEQIQPAESSPPSGASRTATRRPRPARTHPPPSAQCITGGADVPPDIGRVAARQLRHHPLREQLRLRHPSSTGIPPASGCRRRSPAPAPHTSGVRIRYTPSARRSSTVVAVDFTAERTPPDCQEAYGPRLVQEVLPVLCPGPVRILGHVQQRCLGGGHHHPALGAVLDEPFLVVRLQLRQVRAGEEGQAEPGGPAGGGLGGAADQEQRVGLGARARGDADRAAPVGEGLARPGREQRLQQLVLEPPAPGEVHTEQVVLLGPVPDPGDRHQPAAAQQIQYGDLLGEPQRVVQRADDRRDGDGDTPGRAEDRPREGERRRQPVVVGPVVLLRLHGGHAPVVGVRGHLQGRPVTGAELGGTGPGSYEVEAYDRDGHGTSPFTGRVSGGR
ncbi:hypothetical protein SVIOM74S_01885 [Streptomyces violarus]